jgi:uncharacterized protein (DUF1697 family)
MYSYVILIRGINVGLKNRVPMASLRDCLEKIGFSKVLTYIASGNVIVQSSKPAPTVKAMIEEALPKNFKLDDDLIKVLVLTPDYLQSVIT